MQPQLEDDEKEGQDLREDIAESKSSDEAGPVIVAKYYELMVLPNCLTMAADYAKDFRDCKWAIDVDVCTHQCWHDLRADIQTLLGLE
jgi:hypothetical protein